MKRMQNPGIVFWALVASIVLHVVLATAVRPVRAETAPAETIPYFNIDHRFHVVFTPPPTPTPPPKRAVAPPNHAAASPTIHTVKLPPHPTHDQTTGPRVITDGTARPDVAGTPGNAIGTGTPGPQTSATPEITPTPKPQCSAPDIDAKAINPLPPEMPELAQQQGITGTAQVKVELSEAGIVLGVSIYQSSGSAILDQAAMQAARTTHYTPEQRECHAVAGSYLFTAEFSE